MKVLLGLAAVAAMAVTALNVDVARAASSTETFDTAPTGWYVDRFAPAGFTAPVDFGGENVLQLSIQGSQQQADSFYNTQGMKNDNDPGTIYESIDVYLSSALFGSTGRVFGLWGTGVDASDDLSSYPIIEFANGAFRGWDSEEPGAWTNLGIGTAVADSWTKIAFLIDTTNDLIKYFVNGVLLGQANAYGTTSVANTILQGYNAGTDYSVYVDNLVRSTVAPVPVPTSVSFLGAGLAGLGLLAFFNRRKRSNGQMLAA